MNIKILSFCVCAAVVCGLGVGQARVEAAESAYPGLVMPTKDKKSPTAHVEDQAPGYRGLISGKLPPVTKRDGNPTPTDPKTGLDTGQQTPIDPTKTRTTKVQKRALPSAKSHRSLKELARRTRPNSLEKFQLLALSSNKGPFTIQDSLLEGVSLPPFAIEALKREPPKSRDGLSATERSAKLRIFQMLSFLEDEQTAKGKKKAARIIRSYLMTMEDGYETERNIPKRVKLQIGMPDVYIERRDKELQSAIKMVKDAGKYIKKFL